MKIKQEAIAGLPVTIRNLCKAYRKDTDEVSKNEKDGRLEISIYRKGEVTPQILATEIKKLKTAFPSRDKDFFNLLAERIVANGFSDDRLKDAVSKVIDTFNYKEINISDVIGFDKKMKIYTYGEMCNMIYDGVAVADDFQIKTIGEKKYWLKINEI